MPSALCFYFQYLEHFIQSARATPSGESNNIYQQGKPTYSCVTAMSRKADLDFIKSIHLWSYERSQPMFT